MTQIICLANSWKRKERCIAGINPETGTWIRPVSTLEEGQIPRNIRLVENQEPALLDILEIPLAEDGPDFGFQRENRLILAGKWQKVGKVQPQDLIPYCLNHPYILHNHRKYVTVPFLQSKPFAQRQTLQLVQAIEFSAYLSANPRENGTNKWKGNLKTVKGIYLKEATITDPLLVNRLEKGYPPPNSCLVTLGLSMPHIPWEGWEGGEPCWKLITAVIDLN